jgi:hypothetical protein
MIRALASLKLAVVILLTLAAALAVGTFLESGYDTPTASYWVYRARWFHAVLFLFGVNIFAVALSRWPWRKKHTPFLLAHLGILMLLVGSAITQRSGLDGSMRVSEGESSSFVELDSMLLFIKQGDSMKTIEIPWRPPGVSFKPIEISEYALRVDKYLPHAEPVFQFPAVKDGDPAIHLKLEGGPMNLSQDLWLWAGDPSWSSVQMGPARFVLLKEGEKSRATDETRLELTVRKNGSISYRTHSRRGDVREGSWAAEKIKGAVFEPGWMGLKVTVLDWVPSATNQTTYTSARVQYGSDAPPSAIYLKVGKGGLGSEMWLGLGDTAILDSGGLDVHLAYQPRRVMLPFSIELKKFEMQYDPGTRSPASYASQVFVRGDEKASVDPVTISMNEPLEWAGYTFYQASYIPGEPRPTTSIFSVNRDPGRRIKYSGSILIVLGSILLFGVKYLKSRRARRAA